MRSKAGVLAVAMLRDFSLGRIEIRILHRAAGAPVDGLAMIEELRRRGYHLFPGTRYPVPHGLKRAGYLRRADRVVGGRVGRYDASTGEGQALTEGKGPAALPGRDETNEGINA